MKTTIRLRIASGLLVAVSLAGPVRAQNPGSSASAPPPPGRVDAPPLEGPVTDLEPLKEDQAARDESRRREADTALMTHDALRTTEAPRPGDRAHAPKQPPAPIVERPAGTRPERRAEWVPGYWDWDSERAEFVWMGGVWQVAPPGTIWVGSRWMRDGEGWYRRPGFWSRRRGPVAGATTVFEGHEPAWRKSGPPADHPEDKIADAPGPDYFFVPGHYAPDGDQLRWNPGFWTRAQLGWDWIPAHWVRRPTGWEFRAGRWSRDPAAVEGGVRFSRRPTARVVTPGGVPEGIESSPMSPDSDVIQPPRPPGTEDENDPIAAEEEIGNAQVVVPLGGMPYYVIRRPGSYPYGPGGVIVPGAVPPFVRRILDMVLP